MFTPGPIIEKEGGDCCDLLGPFLHLLGLGTVSHECNWCYALLARNKTVGKKTNAAYYRAHLNNFEGASGLVGVVPSEDASVLLMTIV